MLSVETVNGYSSLFGKTAFVGSSVDLDHLRRQPRTNDDSLMPGTTGDHDVRFGWLLLYPKDALPLVRHAIEPDQKRIIYPTDWSST